MNVARKLFSDATYITGIILLSISFAVFLWTDALTKSEDSQFGVFLFHFIIAVIYFVSLMANGKLRKGSGGLPHVFLFLLLSLISAYALNRNLRVFQISVPWVCAAIMTAPVLSFSCEKGIDPSAHLVELGDHRR